MIVIPPKYYAPTRLKDLLRQDNNQFDKLNIDILINNRPFSNSGLYVDYDLTNPVQIYLMYRLLDKYYYSEIGFDIDEQFIDRFVNRWNSLNISYCAQLSEIIDFKLDRTKLTLNVNKMFTRKLGINENRNLIQQISNDLTDTHDLTFGKGVSQTTTNNLTDTATGDNTEYQQVIKDISGTTTRTGTVTVANNGNDTETGTVKKTGTVEVNDGGSKNVNTTETNYSSDRLAYLDIVETIIKDFIQKFENLFMGVFTHL